MSQLGASSHSLPPVSSETEPQPSVTREQVLGSSDISLGSVWKGALEIVGCTEVKLPVPPPLDPLSWAPLH